MGRFSFITSTLGNAVQSGTGRTFKKLDYGALMKSVSKASAGSIGGAAITSLKKNIDAVSAAVTPVAKRIKAADVVGGMRKNIADTTAKLKRLAPTISPKKIDDQIYKNVTTEGGDLVRATAQDNLKTGGKALRNSKDATMGSLSKAMKRISDHPYLTIGGMAAIGFLGYTMQKYMDKAWRTYRVVSIEYINPSVKDRLIGAIREGLYDEKPALVRIKFTKMDGSEAPRVDYNFAGSDGVKLGDAWGDETRAPTGTNLDNVVWDVVGQEELGTILIDLNQFPGRTIDKDRVYRGGTLTLFPNVWANAASATSTPPCAIANSMGLPCPPGLNPDPKKEPPPTEEIVSWLVLVVAIIVFLVAAAGGVKLWLMYRSSKPAPINVTVAAPLVGES